MMTFFVRPIIRPPANLYKNDGGGGAGRGGSKIRVSRNGQNIEIFQNSAHPHPRSTLIGYEMKFCKFVYSCVQATASDKFMHSIKNVKLILAKELGRGV